MPVIESIHGHEVLHMMLTQSSWTRDSLESAITEKFGTDRKFHTCSAEGMSASELIDFLEQRGKFVDSAEGFNTERERICNH